MSDNISDKISNTLSGTNDILNTPDIDISDSSSVFDWIKNISLTTMFLFI
jgi:hypothetical protein